MSVKTSAQATPVVSPRSGFAFSPWLTVVFVFCWLLSSRAPAAIIWGVNTENNLFSFDSAAPQTILRGSFFSGSDVLAIDFRPADPSQLWLLRLPNSIGRVSPTAPGNPTQGPNDASFLTGSAFGFDFDPVADVMRVVSDTEYNRRTRPIPGLTPMDTPLAYALGDPNVGANPSVVALAYTNSVEGGAATTTLFGIDSVLDVLVRIGSVDGTPDSADSGLLTTIGPLGVDATNMTGLDIGPDGVAYAVIQQSAHSGVSGLYTINLSTGAATLVGTIGGGMYVRDIAVVIPEPGALAVLGLGALGLIRRRSR